VVLANFHWHKCDGPPWTYSYDAVRNALVTYLV